ncbi:MarR family winged helix-turn-helix transcriptional regulator [Mycobacterium sp. GA-2829]|uniref:MarR family winged helix-turn-helix transcriptional regulator n=1 Tax=Mycobacterium sp. GA-2829 TaxID=1772283 RepID=UPI00073FFD1D|nr:MarR family winged helix-turn-helix transcriptional regulator [Mycobacterium sp. GA-2829]KUI30246.1 MarR family transcriptional regulator [Mycobacterium sp. GA-2829]
MTLVSEPAAGHRALALALQDLSWRIAKFGPAKVGLEPLPASELTVLRAVMESPGRSVSAVAAATDMQSSNVSTAVRALIDRGLLAKHADPDDRRVSLLEPTPRALAERDAIEDAVAHWVSTALDDLSAADVDALVAATPAIRALTTRVASSQTGRGV